MASNLQSQLNFDGERVFNLFCSSRGEKNVIFVDYYIEAYEELCKLFQLFGTLFGFVVSDVQEKIAILRNYRKGEHSEKYKTVQSVLQFEVSHNLIENEVKPSGTQTLLHLHRALEFISVLILKLRDTNNNEKFSTHASEAYEATLARYHPWLVKQAVHMAMYMLPTRQDFLEKMGVEDDERRLQGMTKLISELNTIFGIIEKLYAKYKLLDMP